MADGQERLKNMEITIHFGWVLAVGGFLSALIVGATGLTWSQIPGVAREQAESTAKEYVDEWMEDEGAQAALDNIKTAEREAEHKLENIQGMERQVERSVAAAESMAAPLEWHTLDFPANSDWDHAKRSNGTFTSYGPVQVAERAGMVYLRGMAAFSTPTGWDTMGSGDRVTRNDNFLSLSSEMRPGYDVGIPVVIRTINPQGTQDGTPRHELGRLDIDRSTGALRVTSDDRAAVSWIILDGVSFPIKSRGDAQASADVAEIH